MCIAGWLEHGQITGIGKEMEMKWKGNGKERKWKGNGNEMEMKWK